MKGWDSMELLMEENPESYSSKPLPQCSPPNWSLKIDEDSQNPKAQKIKTQKLKAKAKRTSAKDASEADKKFLSEPLDLAALIKPLVGKISPVLEPAPKKKSATHSMEELQALWLQVVGPDQAEMSEVIRYRQGVLKIKVLYAPLLAEFRAFAAQGLQKQLVEAGLKNLCELRFSS